MRKDNILSEKTQFHFPAKMKQTRLHSHFNSEFQNRIKDKHLQEKLFLTIKVFCYWTQLENCKRVFWIWTIEKSIWMFELEKPNKFDWKATNSRGKNKHKFPIHMNALCWEFEICFHPVFFKGKGKKTSLIRLNTFFFCIQCKKWIKEKKFLLPFFLQH